MANDNVVSATAVHERGRRQPAAQAPYRQTGVDRPGPGVDTTTDGSSSNADRENLVWRMFMNAAKPG